MSLRIFYFQARKFAETDGIRLLKMTRLMLIRHGETDLNRQRKYCGHSNPPLNKTGFDQSKKIKAYLKNCRFDAVYCSDLQRAFETKDQADSHCG